MRVTTLTLSAALVLSTISAETFAQGRGRGAAASANPVAAAGANAAAGAGLSRRPDFAAARSEGALRAIGRQKMPPETGGNGQSGLAIGAQLNASSAASAALGAPSGAASSSANNGKGAAGQARGQALRESRGLSLHARARQQMVDRVRDRSGDRSDLVKTTGTAGDATRADAVNAPRRAPWERAGVSRADWLLAKRLASIDKLRDKALENGNERLLAQADKLEAVARRQHERRTGEYADPAPQDPAPQDPLPEDPAPQDPANIPDDGTGSDAGTAPTDDTPTELTGEIIAAPGDSEPTPVE